MRSDPGSTPSAPIRMRSVLDHQHPVPVDLLRSRASMSPGRPAKCTGMIAWVRAVMAALSAVEVDQAGRGLAVDQHRRRARMLDRVHGRDERHRGQR